MSSESDIPSRLHRTRRHFLGTAAATGAKVVAMGVLASSIVPGSAWAHRRGGRGGRRHGPVCFLRGTSISTPTGEVCVEELHAGDAVMTANGKSMAIRWVGRQTFRRTGPTWNSDVMPIRIARHALDDSTPVRDLYISPYHHLHVDGVLIQAKDLVNGRSITPALPAGHETIEYFHILLDSHEAVLADGAPVETLRIEDANHEAFVNFPEVAKIMPAALAGMVPFAPIVHQRGRDHLKALLQTVVRPFAKVHDPIGDAQARLAARAAELAC
jgi:hypothetical protein